MRCPDSKPWSNLPDQVEKQVSSMFQASITMMVGDGKRTLFWTDKWLDGESIADIAPCLIRAMGKRTARTRTVHEAMQGRRWVRDITGALTVQVILDYLFIWEKVPPSQTGRGGSGRLMDNSRRHQLTALTSWARRGCRESRAPPKRKFFVWLALHGRCWTAARRKRHNLQDDDACALCGQESETITHLLLGCSYSRQIWHSLLHQLNVGSLTPHTEELSLATWWTEARKQVHKSSRKTFDSMVVLVAWSLWLERNARTFGRRQRTEAELLAHIKEEANTWIAARYATLAPLVLGRNHVRVDVTTGRALVPM